MLRRSLVSNSLPWAILILGLASSCSGPAGDKTDKLPSHPHPVALIVLDGVRADSVDGMPFLGSFAAQSIRFDQAYAQAPDEAASLASTLTGLYPTTHGLVEADERLTDDALTLAELLAEARVPTAAFVNFTDPVADRGLDQGFERFETGPGALEAAARWVSGNSGKNYFLLAATDEASAAAARGGRAGYDAALVDLDGQVRNLVQAIGDSATVAVLATRGSEFETSSQDGPTLHASVTRVPLMIRLPGGAAAQQIDKIVELVDLSPTVLELTGTSVPLELQGTSLLPLIEGHGTPPYIAFGESPHRGGQQYAVLAGFRLIRSDSGDRVELYDLTADPRETTDLADRDSDKVTVLSDRLADWQKFVAATSLDPKRRVEELDDATLERLKELGYIQ